ncbi:hypothetical protein JOM56_009834 [Amanita muscaria]
MSLMIPELIHEIFQHLSTPLRLNELNSFPWHLGHVCATWRTVFMTMPLHFWNKIDIKFDFLDEDDLCHDPSRRKHRYEVMLHVLRFFLDRTNRHPFSFQLEGRPQYATAEEAYVSRILKMLVAESTRWEDVMIRYEPSHVRILYRARNRLPLLRSVQLLRLNFDDERHDLLELEETSCLRSVNISDLRDWKTDWTRLRVLKIGQFYQGERLLSVLSQAKQLEKLAIYQSFANFTLDPSIKPLTFESLKVLTVMDFKLFSIFYAPCLEELYINDWDDEDEKIDESPVHDAITSFLLAASNALP